MKYNLRLKICYISLRLFNVAKFETYIAKNLFIEKILKIREVIKLNIKKLEQPKKFIKL